VAVIGEPGEDGGSDGQRGSRPAAEGQRRQDGAGAPGKPAEEQGTQPAPGRNRPTSMPPAPPAEAATEGRGPSPRPQPEVATQPAPRSGGRVRASPLARRIAAERGVDLGGISGSGPEGRIVARDLENAAPVSGGAAAERLAPAFPAPQPRRPAVFGGDPYTDVPLTQIRKTIAKRLSQSIGPIPTFYLTTEVDMERVWEAREALRADSKRGGGEAAKEASVSFNDIIIKAVALALRQHPSCNAWWQEDHIRYWNQVHISMAVAVEEGLITPVIRHADQKSLREIAVESQDLAARARERKLKPDEYTGGTFSVSNLGMLDIDEFTAVINPPEAGILAVGRIVPKPVAHDGGVALRRRLRLTMSCDHRVIDGATGAQFLKTLKAMLENPLALVW
ncbi:MAG TPA: dihydrolipoamide acetyltransferase family protein, partial [Gemmatimonadales bacterium]|nr:dihydrolipoamide acetyltransferase family protein [Gemmatimonadales bacterium]